MSEDNNSDDEFNQFVRTHLMGVLRDADSEALLKTVLAIADQCGVTELLDRPVIGFYEDLRIQIVERKLRTHADHNMGLVSAMQQLWKAQRDKRNAKPDEE
jgi:hypothetical protein